MLLEYANETIDKQLIKYKILNTFYNLPETKLFIKSIAKSDHCSKIWEHIGEHM